MVTVRFFVGEDREDSLVKLYNKLLSNQDLVPPGLTSWVVKPVEIDDVPIVIATLWSDRAGVDDYDLRRLAQEIALDLQTVPDTNRIEVIGGRPRELRVDIDPTAMAARNTAINDVLFALTASNVRMPSGQLQRADTQLLVETDARIADAASLRNLTVNVVDGVPVRISDIAKRIRRSGGTRRVQLDHVRSSASHRRHGRPVCSGRHRDREEEGRQRRRRGAQRTASTRRGVFATLSCRCALRDHARLRRDGRCRRSPI